MADFVGMLVDMGFERESAQKAVQATGNVDVQSAMDWMLKQKEDEEMAGTSTAGKAPETNGNSSVASTSGETPSVDEVVRSYKCNDCQKVLRNEAEMELHAAKTQHANFSESTEEKKPLTEEEKKEQLRLIDEKIRIKRAEREEREKKEALEREKMRMKSGKELAEYKRRREEQEMKEIADARRKEKNDDRIARERVRAQIEADKQARKAREAGNQAPGTSSSGVSSPCTSSSASSLSSPATSSGLGTTQDEPPVKKDYTETKLQLRLPNGKALIQSFNVKEPLAAVRLYVELNRDDGITTPFNIISTYPRKTFVESDYEMPLDALGLVPSAVLMITKTV